MVETRELILSSDLSGRYQRVNSGGCLSTPLTSSCSVSSEFLTFPLRSVINSHNVNHHLHANETYLYIADGEEI